MATPGFRRRPRRVPLEDYEFDEYVRSFRNSSDRGRWLLFAIFISCFVELVASWNIRDQSWPRAHLTRWRDLIQLKEAERTANELPMTPATTFARTAVKAWSLPSIKAKMAPEAFSEEIRSDQPFAERHEEYMKQFVARMAIVTIPIVGVAIDVNDLGTVFGIWLALLMTVLAVAISREHENLCLAFYKVRMLHESEKRPDDGQSKANLLYHALAMSQVLSSPPTLARWRSWQRILLGWLLVVLYYVPALLQTWIVWTTVQQMRKSPLSTSASFGWKLQVLLIIVLLAAALAATRHSSAMGVRWQRMFHVINPKHEGKPDDTRIWMQAAERKKRLRHDFRWLWNEIRKCRKELVSRRDRQRHQAE
jgi:hypothetical protein